MPALYVVVQHHCDFIIAFDDLFNDLEQYRPHLPSQSHYDGITHLWLFFLSSILVYLHFMDLFVSAVEMGPMLMVDSEQKLFVELVQLIEFVYLIEREILVLNFH